MNTNPQREAASIDFMSIGTMLKARAAEELGERFIYLEAAREGADQQNECVLAKALQDSSEHFLKFGNIDIDHKSMPQVARMYGIEDPQSWEIGVPDDVRVDGASVLVKARLYRGDTPLAAKANMVWDSITKLHPAKRWYASVGGATLAKSPGIDPLTKARVNYVTKVRWSNLAISQQPVNQHVSPLSTVPFGALAKCWTPNGFDMAKALEASYATDVSQLTGGGALSMQSLDSTPHSYYDFREKVATAIKSGKVRTLTEKGLIAFSSKEFNLTAHEAAEWIDRFLADLKARLTNGEHT